MILISADFISLTSGAAAHVHTDRHELHYFVYGAGKLKNGQRSFPFSGCRIFYTPPGTEHAVSVDRDCRFIRVYYVGFSPEADDAELLRKTAQRLAGGHDLTGKEQLLRFEGIVRRFKTGDPDLIKAAGHQLSTVLYDVCSDYSVPPPVTQNPHVARMISLLQEHIYGTLDIDAIAAHVGLNRSYLIRLFQRHTGTTPIKYLLKLKLETAAWLLRNTERRIYRIAEDLRFCDEFYFSRTFKAQTGESPQAYRREKRKLPGVPDERVEG